MALFFCINASGQSNSQDDADGFKSENPKTFVGELVFCCCGSSFRMKRKVVKLSSVRLSPNEEALLIKEEHERRRRLRIKQVREQERSIAVQVREEVKHRRKQQLEQLANDLNAEWQVAQVEKEKSLAKLYLCSLREVGQGHRQAKENEPDLKAQSQQVSVNREKAEKRHREALRELKQQRDKETEVQNRYIKTRKKALVIEKKRAVRIANLPPPLPNPLADLEVREYPAVKMYDVDSFSVTHYHLSEPYVDREINSNQISARLTAEEEAKHLEELQQEAEIERREQLEKARLRGSHALQMVHLVQDREKLVKELEQMQQADLSRRRQAVAQMPPQLFEPPFRRIEVKEDRQREMEFAFEDIYAGDKKIIGDLVLRLEPEPLPAPSVGTQDEDLNLSVEPEGVQKEEQYDKGSQDELAILCLGKTEVPRVMASSQTSESPSKAALNKLLTKIRMQKDHCTSKSESKDVTQGMTIESGSIASEENEQRILTKSTANNDVNKKHLEMQSMKAHANEQQKEVSEVTIMAGSTTLCHPKEQAIRIRSEVDRRKQLHELEQQKQQQLTLIWQSEQQKRNLEAHLQKAQLLQQQADENHVRLSSDFEKQSHQEHGQIKDCLGHQKERKDNTVNEQSTWRPRAAHMDIGHLGVNPELEHCKLVSDELFPTGEHIRKIHQYQQHLIEQNRLHKKSVEEIRKQLEEYELKKEWSSVSTRTRHLSEQHLVSPISHYDKSAGSELQVNTSVNKTEQTFVPFAQNRDFVNQSRTLDQSQPMPMPFVHLHLPKLRNTNTSQSQVSPEIQGPVCTICLPKSSENTSTFLPRHQFLKHYTVLDSSLFKMSQQHAATAESTMTQQIARISDDGSRDSRGPENLNPNESVVYNASNGQHDSPKSKRHAVPYNVLEMNCPEVSKPCIQTSGTVEPQARLMEILGDQSMLQEAQLRTSEISEGTLKQSMLSTTVPKHTETLRDHVSIASIRVQQEHLKELQQQLCRKREELVATRKLQEEFIHRQSHLKEHVQQQHNALEKNNIENQSEHLPLQEANSGSENVEHLNPLSSVLRTLKDFSTGSTKENLQLKNEDQLKNLQPVIQINGALNPSWCFDSKSIQDGSHSSESLSLEVLTKDAQNWLSKPPVSKTRFGLFGLIEQHELSAIQEVESPKSDRLSMFANRNAFSDNCCSSEPRELMSSRMDSSCSSEIDLSRISTSSSSQHSSSVADSTAESMQTGRMTWREKLKLETGSFPGQAIISRLQRYSADVDRGKLEDPGRPSVTCSTASKVLFPYSWSSNAFGFNAEKNPDADQISSTTLSTGSIHSNEQIHVGPMSSGDYPSVVHDVTSEQLTTISSVCTPSSLSSFSANQDTVDVIYCSPKLEEYIPTGSRIQQVIEKYTRNLNQFLDSSVKYQDSTTDHTVSDQGIPNFYLQLQSSQQNSDGEFQPLESRPDFSISDSSLSPTSSKTKDFEVDGESKISKFADDTELGNCEDDAEQLQRDIDKLTKWTDTWQTNFNAAKCENSYVLDTNGTTIDQHSNLATSSKIKSFTDSVVSAVDHGRTACSIDQKEEYIQQGYNVDNGLKHFQGLQLEMIPGLDMDHSGGSLTNDRISEQFNNEASSINSEYRPTTHIIKQGTIAAASQPLEPADGSTCSDLATENLQGGDRETSQYFGSFSPLNATLSSINDDNDNISDQNGKQLEDCECKTPQVITLTKINSSEANEVATLNDLPIEPFKLMLLEEQYCTGSEVNHVSEQNHMLNSEQLPPARAETVAVLENEFECEAEHDLPRSSNLASKLCTIQNIMPVWEIESDVGIMEEPELTQLTWNDSSLADDELGQEFPIENLTTKNELNEFQAFSQLEWMEVDGSYAEDGDSAKLEKRKELQASGLQPKLDTTDHTIFTLHTLTVANHKQTYKESSPQKSPTVMIFEFESPKVQNEAVLKKEKKFLANSAKRLENMKRKERSGVVKSGEHCKKPIPLKQEQTLFASSSLAAQLKMVGEVKVSTPEDRRAVEIEMRQRTFRLYNQLDEVKNRKKKMTSQIVCARNRERVKEFQKKTLEKLRAKINAPVMLHDR
ncbi:centrosomal protein of 295 kDa [Scyliorhinus canicula]|uniref:centrosomal protein of 295 kDa n=1 Tax=Scyliorhinus canicula TaxID=7830 RepID=UPI0018F445EA|nr:centrosomal protein of 295 kDa [Scyliorhinus canicula]